MNDDPIYICSYPKSGRTWMRFLLANYFNIIFNLGLKIHFKNVYEIVPNNDDGPIGYLNHDKRFPLILCDHDEQTLDRRSRCKIIILSRDEKDVLVSQYFHETKHESKEDMGIEHFIKERLASYRNRIKRQQSISHRNVCQSSYENLMKDTKNEFSRIIYFITGQEPDEQAVARAISLSSFENMLQLEAVQNTGKYDFKDIDARRVRRGKIGGYTMFLDKETVERLFGSQRPATTNSII